MMIKYITAFFKRLYCGMLWIKALDLSSSEEYDKAAEILNKTIQIDVENSIDTEFYLLLSFVQYKRGLLKESLAMLKTSRERLQAVGSYSCEEKNYFYCFGDSILKGLKNNKAIKLDESLYLGDFTKINDEKVRSTIRSNFPIEYEEK